ncbi:Protein spaetzle [Orchesella cincta]|uniref:Protein spaetzle n=1 Tax=Orchesella cincta TaxID=48709 RepID=A0A1D2NN87_ORCCI|nr:Protein spaetzle [Orchesella cincta]
MRIAILLCPCVLLDALVNCASVEVGSHLPPVASHLNSSSINNRSNVGDSHGPLATNSQNDPREDHSSRNSRRLQTRQVSTSEWIFSSLVQPDQAPSSSTSQQTRQQRRGNSGLAYRSVAPVATANYYTNYYRNHNIYAQQTARHINGNDDKSPEGRRYSGHASDKPETFSADNRGALPAATTVDNSALGLSRRRAPSPLLPSTNDVGNSMSSVTSKMPEVQPGLGTTGLSKTAPATDPTTLLLTDRPTSTQEMQITNDDDLQFEARAEIGRGMKRPREMNSGTDSDSLHFEDSAPIVFPGTTTMSDRAATLRPYMRPGKDGDTFAPDNMKVNPFDARLIDGWKRLYELRKKSQSFDDSKKSSIASDQSADAKIINMLTIHGTPKCAALGGYCTEIDSYPRSFFNQILNKTLSPDIFKNIFGETTDNKTVEHTIYPKAAQNRKGKFMYIVNHDEYLQGIRVETCTKERDTCNMFDEQGLEGHLPGYTSICKQKYIYKKLLAFTPDGKAMPDTFRLPSCCVCHIRSKFISDRINPGADIGDSDVHPTMSADDNSWSPSSSTHDPHETSSVDPLDSGGITFPTSTNDDLSSYQVPTPTTSTSSSRINSQHQTVGQQHNRAENQTASRRLH